MLEKSKKVRHTWARTMCHVVRAYIPSLILPSPSRYVIVDSYNNKYMLVKSKKVKSKTYLGPNDMSHRSGLLQGFPSLNLPSTSWCAVAGCCIWALLDLEATNFCDRRSH